MLPNTPRSCARRRQNDCTAPTVDAEMNVVSPSGGCSSVQFTALEHPAAGGHSLRKLGSLGFGGFKGPRPAMRSAPGKVMSRTTAWSSHTTARLRGALSSGPMRVASISAAEACDATGLCTPLTESITVPLSGVPAVYCSRMGEKSGQTATVCVLMMTGSSFTRICSWRLWFSRISTTTSAPFIQLRTRRAPPLGASEMQAQMPSVSTAVGAESAASTYSLTPIAAPVSRPRSPAASRR
jgi:hypothetical protein